MDIKDYLSRWAGRYRSELTADIMPFWTRNGYDRVNGGVYTCLDRDGSLMDPTKSVWFQGRFAYVCALAYNNVERDPRWLEMARGTLDFIERHCFDADGHMYFSVTADGRPLRQRRYVFSEAFAAMAMAEYSLATGDASYAARALRIFHDARRFLDTPGYLAPKFEPDVRLRSHSIVMIMLNVASCLLRVIDAPELREQIEESVEALRRWFIHPEFKALLETVGENGEFIDTNLTRTINPGHCIETSWFLLEESRRRGWDPELTETALTVFDWSWDWGWDKRYGGIINFRDCRRLPPQDYSQDMKFWWPQCETIIASLYAYLATGNEDYIYRHHRISEWTWAHLPDARYGEWYGYLHRDGTVAQPAKGNLYKGPFHIPRMMVRSYMLCNDILKALS